ncbi:MAG: ABC transporter permease [Ethanoligenens sp.]|uniref:ABC transporter permease n=1 Tax=Ethanoligenens sp. TaxID=2099655 RepID=UPI0039EAE92A
MMRANSKAFHILAPLAVIAALLLVWQVGCTVFQVSFHLLPKPTQIFSALGRNFAAAIYPDMIISLRVMLIGYLIAVPLGFAVAAIASQFKLAVRTLLPVLIILMVTPMATLVPEFKLFWGVSPAIKIVVVILQCAPVIAVNSITGFINVSADKRNLMKAFGCGRWETFFRVVIPNAMPQVFTGLKLGCILCTIAAMSADLSVGQGGLGYRIAVASSMSATDTAYAAILIAAVIGVLLYMVVSVIESRVITWK